MKNVQIIDGADNATFSVFRATDDEFEYLFPNPGQDIELVEDFTARHHEDFAKELLRNLWSRPVEKQKAHGIDGTLFFGYEQKREHLPPSKCELDRDPSQINAAQRELYGRVKSGRTSEGDEPVPATTRDLLNEVPGGPQLLQWNGGRVPSFHDAEVLSLGLDREGERCSITIHAFQMTSEVDARGYFVLKNHVIVRFKLEGVTALELADFNGQNAIYGLSLSRTPSDALRLELDRSYGLFGFVEARNLTIELEPGLPRTGVYSRPNE